MQNQNLPFLLVEHPHRLFQSDRLLGVVVKGEGGLLDLLERNLSGGGTQAGAGNIFGDGQNPCHRLAHRQIQVGSAANLQIGVHHHVLRLVVVAGQRQGKTVDGAVGGVVQLFKRLLAALCDFVQKGFQLLRVRCGTKRL